MLWELRAEICYNPIIVHDQFYYSESRVVRDWLFRFNVFIKKRLKSF